MSYKSIFENFHWTSRRHLNLATVLPCFYIAYCNVHYTTFYKRFFLKSSYIGAINEDISNLIEQELETVSEYRAIPLQDAKFDAVLIDNIESKTNGSFHMTTTTLFRFSSRIAVNDISTLREKYPNLLTMVCGRDCRKLQIDPSTISDENLKKFTLSPDAKRYALIREILRADSLAGVFIPVLSYMSCFAVTFPLLVWLRKVLFPLLAFVITSFLSIGMFIVLYRPLMLYQEKVYDKLAFLIDKKYISGCKDYLKQSMELGKFLYQSGEKDLFSENGDCKSHLYPYSKRLQYVENFQRKRKDKKKRK